MQKVSPLREQYLSIKRDYPNHIVLFQLGDFYEAFDDDARKLSDVLDLVLTNRPTSKTERAPMAGFPIHALDDKLKELVEKNIPYAVVEQTKEIHNGLCVRKVTRVYPSEIATAGESDAEESIEDLKAEIARLQAISSTLRDERDKYHDLWIEADNRYDELLVERDRLVEQVSGSERVEIQFYNTHITGKERKEKVEQELTELRNQGWEIQHEKIVVFENLGDAWFYYARLERKARPAPNGQKEPAEKQIIQAGPVVSLTVPQSFAESVRSGSATPDALKVIGNAEIDRARAIPVIAAMETIIERGLSTVPGARDDDQA